MPLFYIHCIQISRLSKPLCSHYLLKPLNSPIILSRPVSVRSFQRSFVGCDAITIQPTSPDITVNDIILAPHCHFALLLLSISRLARSVSFYGNWKVIWDCVQIVVVHTVQLSFGFKCVLLDFQKNFMVFVMLGRCPLIVQRRLYSTHIAHCTHIARCTHIALV